MGTLSTPRPAIRAIACAFVLATPLAACGDDDGDGSAQTPAATSTPTTQLDTKKVAKAIRASIRDQRDIRAKVTCPEAVVQAKDRNFVCLAKTKDGTTRFAVVQTDDAGNVTYSAEEG